MTLITTVEGAIPAAEAGMVLPHEHLFGNFMAEYRGTGLTNDLDLTVEEVDRFIKAGGGTIVDVTPAELTTGAFGGMWDGPDSDREMQREEGCRSVSNVASLVEVSRRTGAHVVASTGHYRDPYLDLDWFNRTTVDRIAELMVRDIEDGFPGTAVRAGVIGEIGADKWYISASEERSFRAAARAHRRTGLTITTHAARWPVGLAQLALLQEEGVDPERVIIGHVDTVPDPNYAIELAGRGCYVQLDTFFDCVRGGQIVERSLRTRVETIVNLVRNGYGDRVLISQDVCLSNHHAANGGTGWAFLSTVVLNALTEAGLDHDQAQSLMTDNAQRALAV